MTLIVEQLLERAQTLSVDERVHLAEGLLYSLQPTIEPSIDAEWSDEVGRRVKTIAEGTASLTSVRDVISSLRRALG